MRIFFGLLLCIPLVFAQEIKVLAASNLKLVLEKIRQEFREDYPNDEVKITYLSSGKAYAQIKSGLNVDLFFSADMLKPQRLADEGLTLFDPQVYALGKLVLCTTGDLNISTDRILTSSKVQHIAIANPRLAPYGLASMEFLQKIGLYDALKEKFVVGDNIGQALNYVKTQGAEIGLNALSLVIFDPAMHYRILDKNLYSPIKQGFVILKQTSQESLARAFARFVMSEKGQEIFKQFGYDRQ